MRKYTRKPIRLNEVKVRRPQVRQDDDEIERMAQRLRDSGWADRKPAGQANETEGMMTYTGLSPVMSLPRLPSRMGMVVVVVERRKGRANRVTHVTANRRGHISS